MSTPRKYTKGETIRDPRVVFSLIIQGERLFLGERVLTHGFLANLSASTIKVHAESGRFAFARERRG